MDFFILALATWRISSLLVNEEGPAQLLLQFREWTKKFTDLFGCVWCTSIWIGVILTVAYWTIPVYTTWACWPLALSALAILVDRYSA